MHIAMHSLKKRIRAIAVTLAASSLVIGNVASVAAADLDTASLALSDPRTGQTSTYTFDANGFTTGTAIGCVQMVLSINADGTGGVPTGITTTSSTYDSATLLSDGNWAVSNPANGTVEIRNTTTTETPVSTGNVVWGAITNGSSEGTTYFSTVNTFVADDCTGSAIDEVTVAFVYKDGEPVQLTVDPTLTFVCNAVGSSQSVNGATTTHASTASGIDYDNDVTTGTNGVSAHDLDVTTNASAGYVVYIRHTGDLTSQNGDTIDNLATHTNPSPGSFSAAGTEAWGYTSNDSTLDGGTADRFTSPANQWAAFSGSNEEVASNTAAVTGTETTRVGHQVGVASDTEAGTYQTTIVYSVVATF